MKLKNILIIASDIEKSKVFYKELFGLHVVTDFGKNVIMTEGLVLQERDEWETAIGRSVRTGGNDAELYFEEYDLDGFLRKLESYAYKTQYVIEPEKAAESGGGSKRAVWLYDPDGHIIEVAEAGMGGHL